MTWPGADNDLVRAPGRAETDAARCEQAPADDPTASGAARYPFAPTFGSAAPDAVAGAEPLRRSRLLLRSFVAAVAGALSAVAAVLLTRNGIRTDDFPPFLEGATATPITRYSGPWLTAGAGAALLATLLLLCAAIDVIRWDDHRRQQRRSAPAMAGGAPSYPDVIGSTPL